MNLILHQHGTMMAYDVYTLSKGTNTEVLSLHRCCELWGVHSLRGASLPGAH